MLVTDFLIPDVPILNNLFHFEIWAKPIASCSQGPIIFLGKEGQGVLTPNLLNPLATGLCKTLLHLPYVTTTPRVMETLWWRGSSSSYSVVCTHKPIPYEFILFSLVQTMTARARAVAYCVVWSSNKTFKTTIVVHLSVCVRSMRTYVCMAKGRFASSISKKSIYENFYSHLMYFKLFHRQYILYIYIYTYSYSSRVYTTSSSYILFSLSSFVFSLLHERCAVCVYEGNFQPLWGDMFLFVVLYTHTHTPIYCILY